MRLLSKQISIALLMTSRSSVPHASLGVHALASGQQGGETAATAGSADEQPNEIPQLPASSGDPNIPSIKLGETIRFEEWGPIILNTDGTTRRIENWD